MTVDAVRLENFMGFEDTGWIDLRPICLLFGRNSSGKSAIIRALRLLKQSLDCDPEDGPLVFVNEGDGDFGSFLELIHRQDRSRLMAFHFRCQLLKTADIIVARINQERRLHDQEELTIPPSQNWAELKLGFSWNKSVGRLELFEVKIDCLWTLPERKERWTLFGGMLPTNDEEDDQLEQDLVQLLGDGWYFWSDVLRPTMSKESTNLSWSDVSIDLASGFIPVLSTPQNDPADQSNFLTETQIASAVLRELKDSVELFLRNLQYLGPIRPSPQRVYMFDSHELLAWKQRGWYAFRRYLTGDVDASLTEEIDEWLVRLELGKDVNSFKEAYAGGLVVVSQIGIREAEAEHTVNFADVGFGVSQVLPVIIQCLLAKRESLIIIEQPELHLHPRAQAELGDLFIDVCRRNRRRRIMEAKKRGILEPIESDPIPEVRFLIETHSEHLLLRLRRRIAEASIGRCVVTHRQHLPQQSLRAYFVRRPGQTSSVESIQISRLGEMSSPPGFEGFFSDDLRETAALARARLNFLADESERNDPGN